MTRPTATGRCQMFSTRTGTCERPVTHVTMRGETSRFAKHKWGSAIECCSDCARVGKRHGLPFCPLPAELVAARAPHPVAP